MGAAFAEKKHTEHKKKSAASAARNHSMGKCIFGRSVGSLSAVRANRSGGSGNYAVAGPRPSPPSLFFKGGRAPPCLDYERENGQPSCVWRYQENGGNLAPVWLASFPPPLPPLSRGTPPPPWAAAARAAPGRYAGRPASLPLEQRASTKCTAEFGWVL